ncbi:MAG: DUF2497 domain-containing protein [Caulobacteraceae bacterium]|nr:DUF2497 domain-containing protein [Caulobacteraceae bacterium]
MSEPNAPEPTMEEILASIRRIISEDEPPPSAAAPEPEPEPVAAAAAPPVLEPEPEDVLELTEPMAEPSPLESIGDLDIMPAAAAPSAPVAPAYAPPPEPAPAAYRAPAPIDDEPLVGDIAADSAASAFGHLAQHLIMPAEGRTLEDVVRELLKPLLKTWLDTHLPGIVQAKVDEEVARIARRRV